MKRNYIFGTMFAVALGVSVAAQSPTGQTGTPPQGTQTHGSQTPATPASPTTPATPPTTGSQIQKPVPGTQGTTPPASQPLTVTGCLTGGTGMNAAYTLNGVTGGAANSPTSYTLLGGDRSAMGQYGNSRVEVIGTTAPQPGSASQSVGTSGRAPVTGAPGAPATGATGATAAGGNGTAAAPPTGTGTVGAGTAATGAAGSVAPTASGAAPTNFTVTSIRQVPGTCGGN